MKARFLLLLFFVASFGFLFKTSVFAQTTNYPLKTNADVPRDFHTYTQSVVLELLSAASCQLAGIDPISKNGKCLGVDPKTGNIGFVENGGGAIGVMGNLIAKTYNIPISTSSYVRDLAGNFGIAKKTLASFPDPGGGSKPRNSGIGTGVGFQGLLPILDLWKAFRNIVYLFFVLVFVVIGLGIMFRIKIDPRTVMTLQNQIPKIIIALVLVTFSYAIAGFLIDMMYVLMFIIFNIFAPFVSADGLNPATLQGSNPLTAIGFLNGLGMVYNASNGIGGIIGSLFDGTIGQVFATIFTTIIGGGAGMLAGGWGALIGAGVGLIGGLVLGSKIFSIIGGVIAFVILAAAVLTALFRLWFQLLKAYIFILINTVIAPFWIAGGLIPGSTKNFGMWIRDMIGNLSAFPATLFMLLIGKVFIDSFGNRPSLDQFVPPFVGNPGDTDSFGALIGVGIVLLTPQVVTMVRAAIKAPEGKYSSAVASTIKAGAGMNQQLLAPAGRNLFGRKNPFTGKREGGVIPWASKRGIQRIYNQVPGGGQGGILSRIGRPIRAYRNASQQARIDARRRTNAEEEMARGGGGTQGGTPPATPGGTPPATPPPAAGGGPTP